MKKRLLTRIIFWSLALAATLFACHVSRRLREASDNYVAFNIGEEPATFSDLVLYAAYLYIPASFDACVNRLRKIDGATQQWALEHDKKPEDKVTWNDLLPYLRNRRPWCPYGGIYLLQTVEEGPKCTVRGHGLPK